VAERRVAAPQETASTMAIEASRQALDQAGVDADGLDLIIVATTTPDGMFPAVASLVQEGLGAGVFGLEGPTDVVMVGPDSTVFVSTAAQNQLSIIVVLEGFANLGLVRIEVERLTRELADVLGI